MVARTAAWRTYNFRVIWLSLLYAIFLIGAVYGFKHQLLSGPAAYVAAILPALPIIGIFGVIGRYLVEEQDEYVRMRSTPSCAPSPDFWSFDLDPTSDCRRCRRRGPCYAGLPGRGHTGRGGLPGARSSEERQ